MNHDIEMIRDGDGVALFGDPAAIDRFLNSSGVTSRELDVTRFRPKVATAATVAQIGAEVAANAGRWVQLTEKSASLLKVAPGVMTGSSPGVSRAILTDSSGHTAHILEIIRTPASMLTNPAILAGVAGIMAQYAMQKQMEEITEYLAVIDAKVDDILRAQKDAVVADMIGVALVIDEAIIVRDYVGRVSEVTWSKVQSAPQAIARTQAYALRQLDGIAEKLERQRDVAALAEHARAAETEVEEWLAVLARCFQLHDALGVLELDRMLDAAPDEIDRHRVALRVARNQRTQVIARTTSALLRRMDDAADRANAKVLLHPLAAPSVVRSSIVASDSVLLFRERLSIEQDADDRIPGTRRWREAVVDAKDSAISIGTDGIGTAARVGAQTVDRGRATAARLAGSLSKRLSRDGDASDVE